MNAGLFIGNQMLSRFGDKVDLALEDCDTICCFSGKRINKGVPTKKLIKKTFTDHDYLKYKSDYASPELAIQMTKCIENYNTEKDKTSITKLLNYSFICYEDDLIFLKRDKILETLLNIRSIPFVFCVTYSFKKYISFKSEINYNHSKFTVETDLGRVYIDIDLVKKLLPICQSWYTEIPGKKETYFTKAEILDSTAHFKRITNYGIEKFYKENKILEPYRKTTFLKLLVHILNKKEN